MLSEQEFTQLQQSDPDFHEAYDDYPHYCRVESAIAKHVATVEAAAAHRRAAAHAQHRDQQLRDLLKEKGTGRLLPPTVR